MARAQARIEARRAAELAGEAHSLTADLMRPSMIVYWADLTVTALCIWGALVLAVIAPAYVAWPAAAVGVLALYRGVSFIHELTHLRPREAPGFHLAWNALIGVPFLVPSLLYEGVHTLHHAKARYGTVRDPEYLPLSKGPPETVALFVAAAPLAPVGAWIRFAILAPLSLLWPGFRRLVVQRFSALVINPQFLREDFDSVDAAWRVQEASACLWSWALVGLVLTGGLAARAVLAGAAMLSVTALINQIRTLAAHAWTGEGEPMGFTEQFLDSINVPPPGWAPLIWAPVGLRYHALHHLLPGVPYHNLAEAHRRLAGGLAPESSYHLAAQPSLRAALRALSERVRSRA